MKASTMLLLGALAALWMVPVPHALAQAPTEEELKEIERQAEQLQEKQAEAAAKAEAKRKAEAEKKAAATAEAKRKAAQKRVEEERRAAEEARSARPESAGRERAAYEKLIIGTWRSREVTPEGAVITSHMSYAPGGRTSGIGRIQGRSDPIVWSGTWNIKDGYLHSTIESSNVPRIIPTGFTSSAEIIDITDRELTYISPFDGKTKIEYRAR